VAPASQRVAEVYEEALRFYTVSAKTSLKRLNVGAPSAAPP
jgi:hypothetical protein